MKEEDGRFWVNLSENGEEMKKIIGVRYGEFKERKWRWRESVCQEVEDEV